MRLTIFPLLRAIYLLPVLHWSVAVAAAVLLGTQLVHYYFLPLGEKQLYST